MGNLIEGGEENVEQLLNSIPGGEASPEVPAKFNNIERVAFEQALVEATGGKIKGVTELTTLHEVMGKFEQSSKRAAELEAQLSGAYANEKVAKLNELYKRGATDNEIDNFLKVQKLDVTKMSPLEKIRAATIIENPDFDESDLDAYITDKYGALKEDELEESSKYKVKQDQRLAEQKIKEAQVQSGETEKDRLARAGQEQLQKRYESWNRVAEKAYGKKEKAEIEVSIPAGKDKADIVKIAFDVPESTRKLVSEQLAVTATKEGWKLTEAEIAEKGNSMYERMLFAMHGKEILTKAVAQVRAEVTKQQKGNLHGIPPRIPSGEGGKKHQDSGDSFRKSGYAAFNKKQS